MALHEIKSYQLTYFGKNSAATDYTARIFLLDANDAMVGYVSFYSKWNGIPDNSLDTVSNPQIIYVNMHENKISVIVDMLRNEKPCYVSYTSPTNAQVRTENTLNPAELEPVGEGE